ncbi:serum amyloid A-5 protein-like [Eleutherodactylus coqui]|uniref:serum amyloid A-5 protein-like n=1 Tax=Eleutherodactylus coqui TaxID=57060 RepID=UPI0034624798
MKVPVLLLLVPIVVAHAQFQSIFDGAKFVKEAAQGSLDMARAYMDMLDANYKDSDKYFHARGNYDAAQRGSGGAWAAKLISDARQTAETFFGTQTAEDHAADQKANTWGRYGGDPNHYRPKGLPDKY